MRVVAVAWVIAAWVTVGAGAPDAAARPTVAITGIDVAGDSVGVDVEAVGIARELTRALRRAADREGQPLQVVDPMVRADDVEALVWGKLIRDGDTWVATIHLSAVGADGDTVSYRATIPHTGTSSIELEKWGRTIYDALLDQIDLTEDKVALPAPAGTPGPSDVFTVRDPTPDLEPDLGPEPTPDPAAVDTGATFQLERPIPPDPPPNAGARRLFWISAGVAVASAALWTVAAFQVDDAEDQIERLAGCTNCDRALAAANAQGNRWESISWLAGTATVAGTAAALLFGYQGYIVGRKPAPSELVGRRAQPHRSVTVAPVVGPDRVGAGVMVTF
jgi:hypothetical protein